MPKKWNSAPKQRNIEQNNKRRKLIVSEALSTNNEKIVFSFENFAEKLYGFDCDSLEFKNLIKHLKKLSSMTWQQIQNSDRHGLGSEKIEKSQLKENLPQCYSEEDFVLSFRYSEKKPFIGIRNGKILDILYLDPTFDLYEHS